MAEALVDAEACSTTMDVNLQPSPPEEMTIEDKNTEKLVVVEFDNDYMRTAPAIVCFLQVIVSIIALMCAVSSGRAEEGWGGYLLLPLSGHLRVFVFAAVCALLTSILRMLLNCSGLLQSLPLQWDLFDLLAYSVLSLLCLLASSLVVNSLIYYEDPALSITRWTIEELIVAALFGYIDMVLFAISAILAYTRWRGSSQFVARRFSSSASQRSQQSSTGVSGVVSESQGAAAPTVSC